MASARAPKPGLQGLPRGWARKPAAFVALALCSASPALASWQEARSRHFIIYSEESAADLRDYATKLERFDQAVRISRNMADPPLTDSGRLTIFALKNSWEVSGLPLGGGTFGLYLNRPSGSYAFVIRTKSHAVGEYDSDIVFFHEYAHHLMLSATSVYYPLWLVEGFAEFLSTADVADDGTVTIGAAANHRSAGVFAPNDYLPLSSMVADNNRALSGWQEELLYSRAWLLTHFLTFEPSRKGQLEAYIQGIRSGLDPAESARKAFGDLRRLDLDLNSYARAKTLSATVVHTDSAKIGPIEVSEVSPSEAAVLPVRMKLLAVSDATAGKVAAEARKVAGKYPHDPAVEATLAQAEYLDRDYASAIAAADASLKADPQNVRAMIVKGRSLTRMEKAHPTGTAWDDIRSWYIRANHVDPENPEPLALYYQSFRDSGATPTDGAVKGLLYALVLEPHNDSLRLMAVRQLVVDNRLAEAKTALIPLASNPHLLDFHDTARDIEAALDASDRAKAMALLDDWYAKQDKND